MTTTGDLLRRFVAMVRGLPENTRDLLHTILLGVASALSAVAFLLLTNYVFKVTYLAFMGRSLTFFLTASFCVIMGTSLAVGLLLSKIEPDAAGSGIPQLKAAYWKEVGYVHWRPVLVKFIAGVLSLGGGASLGREGPTVYIGGGLSSVISGFLGYPKRLRRGTMVIGASAGLAAAFNTPLAAITFVLEEIISDINSRIIGRVVLTSVLGAFVVYAIVGRQPAFTLPAIDTVSWKVYVLYPLVALIASLAGVVFQRATLSLRDRLKGQASVPPWFLPCCGGFITWVIGSACFIATGKVGIFGLGYHDLSEALSHGFIWWVAGVLLAGKLLAFIVSYGFGGCGGIFSPSLFIGGMSGFFLSGIAGFWLDLSPSDHIAAAAVGMTACLGSIIRAPLTSLLIVFEMTHQFALVPGLMIAIIISKIVTRRSGDLNFYDAVLVHDGHELIRIRPPVDIRAWQNLPVSAIANHRPVIVESLEKDALREVVEKHPYNGFPVVMDGKLTGLVTRARIEEALRSDGTVTLEDAVTCHFDQPVRDVADKFIESPAGVMVVMDRVTGRVAGIITLHDLLRAQASMMD